LLHHSEPPHRSASAGQLVNLTTPSSPTRVPGGSAMPATGAFSWPPTPLWGRTASGGVGA
jgi:hypothetical protein